MLEKVGWGWGRDKGFVGNIFRLVLRVEICLNFWNEICMLWGEFLGWVGKGVFDKYCVILCVYIVWSLDMVKLFFEYYESDLFVVICYCNKFIVCLNLML